MNWPSWQWIFVALRLGISCLSCDGQEDVSILIDSNGLLLVSQLKVIVDYRRVGYFPVDNGFESSSQFYRADSFSLCCGSEEFNDVHLLVRKDKFFACTTNVCETTVFSWLSAEKIVTEKCNFISHWNFLAPNTVSTCLGVTMIPVFPLNACACVGPIHFLSKTVNTRTRSEESLKTQ